REVRVALASRLEPIERLLEEAARRLEAALVQLEVRERVERAADELLEALVLAALESGACVEDGALVLAALLVRVRRDVRGQHAVVAARAAEEDLLQPAEVEIEAIDLEQSRRAVAGEEVLELPVLPGTGQGEAVLV